MLSWFCRLHGMAVAYWIVNPDRCKQDDEDRKNAFMAMFGYGPWAVESRKKERPNPDWPRLLWNLVVALEEVEEDRKRMRENPTMLGSESLARSVSALEDAVRKAKEALGRPRLSRHEKFGRVK